MGSSPIFHPIKKEARSLMQIRLRVLHIGLSPSGKATDFDSVIPWVRIPPAQPVSGSRKSRGNAISEVFLFLLIPAGAAPKMVLSNHFLTGFQKRES